MKQVKGVTAGDIELLRHQEMKRAFQQVIAEGSRGGLSGSVESLALEMRGPVTEGWWADVLADPRARKQRQPHGYPRQDTRRAQRGFYRLADEPRPVIEVACGKCEWKAAFSRAELIAKHGAEYPLPNLLEFLATPGCPKIKNQWDRCGVYYVNPIEG
jgi:hypothetical protein